jgi:hypothetical protein
MLLPLSLKIEEGKQFFLLPRVLAFPPLYKKD